MTVRRIGNATVDFAQLTIEGDAGKFSVEPKVLDVLERLIEHDGEVVEREALIDEVWGVSYGGDERLSRAISLLRKALGDDARDHRYIQTIPKRGYRLVAGIADADGDRAIAAPVKATTQKVRPRATLYLAGLGLAVVLAIAGIVNWGSLAPGRASYAAQSPAGAGQMDHPNSIAVLPFSDLSPQGNQGYLADGLAEELINAITKFPDVRVVGQTSSFRFREDGDDLDQVGEALNVRYLLTGSVRRQQNQLRVAAQLVAAEDGHVMWSETYNGTNDRLLEYQESIARAIARELNIAIASRGQLLRGLTKSQEAYDLFVQGRYLSRQFGRDNKKASLRLLRQATEIDPEFALAWAWIGRSGMLLAISSDRSEKDQLVAEARIVTSRALSIDPELAIAHYVQALLHDYDLDLAASQDAMERAYQADPNRPLVISRRGHYYANVGINEKAEEFLTEGVRRDPTDSVALLNLARIKAARGDYSRALELVDRSIDLEFTPATGWKCVLLGFAEGEDAAMDCWMELPAVFRQRYDPPFSGDQQWELIGDAVFRSDERARTAVLNVLDRFFAREDAAINPYIMDLQIGLRGPELYMERFVSNPYPLNANGLATIWMPGERYAVLRQHPNFPAFAERIGMVRAWEKYGWPDQCTRRGTGADGRPLFDCK